MGLQIRLRRQGVATTLRRSFAPCPHGHSWHIQIQDVSGYPQCGVLVELSYPNCSECYDPPKPKLSDYPDYEAFYHAQQAWRPKSGQICASNNKTYRSLETIEQGRQVAIELIRNHVPGCKDATFHDRPEAYMFYTASDYRIYRHLHGDRYITPCLYHDDAEEIRLLDGTVLVSFRRSTTAMVCVEGLTDSIRRALRAFRMPVNQRNAQSENRGWLAWLIGEYIKDDRPELPVEELPYVVTDRRN
jgi:hypothetical protein